MNVISFQVMDYDDFVALRLRKNKAKTNPISKACPKRAARKKRGQKKAFQGTGAGNDGESSQTARNAWSKKIRIVSVFAKF